MSMNDKTRFLVKNLSRGLLWLIVIVTVFIFVTSLIDEVHFEAFLEPIYDEPFWVFVVFMTSEVVFGIIPPELFMLLSAQKEDIVMYSISIGMFAVLSYIAGVIGFYIGRVLENTKVFKYIYTHFLEKYVSYLRRFGGFLIVVASLTPLPFSAIAMLMGGIGYSRNKYLIFSLFRFVRFIVYSILIWNTNMFT